MTQNGDVPSAVMHIDPGVCGENSIECREKCTARLTARDPLSSLRWRV